MLCVTVAKELGLKDLDGYQESPRCSPGSAGSKKLLKQVDFGSYLLTAAKIRRSESGGRINFYP